MLRAKREHPKVKSQLHPRNKHRERYDFKLLIDSCPQLEKYVVINAYGDESIDFFDPDAVKSLNKSLLKHFYNIEYWEIPPNYLCPPIPGRADYLHYAADLLSFNNNEIIPTGEKIRCLDIGVGANCIYPVIGNTEYGWSFLGSDIDTVAIISAQKIIDTNPRLQGQIELKLQDNPKNIFSGIIKNNELFDITFCNPPFHASPAEARAGTLRKLTNLTHKKVNSPLLNFGGQNSELWYNGGEEQFVKQMIRESRQFSDSCFWFTSLISKESNLKNAYQELRKAEARQVKTIPMGQGNKISRIVAWTFLTAEQQKKWAKERWNTNH